MRKPPSAPSNAPTAAADARPPKVRRSLTHVGGEVETRGEPRIAKALARALEVKGSTEGDVDPETGIPSGESEARAHVHGFHVYPARMHPRTAERLVVDLAPATGTVLDPFCGSGTVLVEARLAGRRAIGVDCNPLAVQLARRKTTPASAEQRAALVAAAAAAAAVANERRKAKAGASRRYPPEDVASFDAHVLLELDGLRVGIEACTDLAARSDLQLVLSSILVKLSKRRSDTSDASSPKRLAAGYPSRLFVKKTEELARTLEGVEADLARAPQATVLEGDARELRGVGDASVDLIVTSPPYAGVYDYLEHHRARLRWLAKDARGFSRAEIGAKRALSRLSPEEAVDAYGDEMTDALRAMHRVLKPGALAALLVADSAFGRVPLAADDLVIEAGRRAGFQPRASASQVRPHFDAATMSAFARKPRREHVVVLQRDRAPASPVRRSR
jgi:DNA modification methylase